MATPKKKTSENAEKKNIKETNPTKPNPEKKKKKKSKSSSKKPEGEDKTSNGIVSEPEVIIVPISSTESQEQQQQKIISDEATSPSKKIKTPKKSSKKPEEDKEEDATMCRFPMERIRRIMKVTDSDCLISGDAVFLVNKATEKFLERFSEDAYASSVNDRKKSVAYKHLASVVSKERRYDFLTDFVPEKIKAKDALAEWKSAEAGEG